MKYNSVIKLAAVILLMTAIRLEAVNMDKKIATFAGGCFWCVEQPFEGVEGVVEAISGYTGGGKKDPTYEQVSSGTTGHLESVRVVYDPSKISYARLLDIFWKQIDPADAGGQFADRGGQYAAAIFYHDQQQKQAAESSKKKLDESGIFEQPVVARVLPAGEFYPAEYYHQDYAAEHPLKYRTYKHLSGRSPFLKKTWKNNTFRSDQSEARYTRPSDRNIKKMLTTLQYEVTQMDGTERPFSNAYWDNVQDGIYIDLVSGEPLFSSNDKFKSGTGWPSFTKPLEPGNIVEKAESKLFIKRVEVRSAHADSHLGHVFDDGPEPTGLRYCLNSAALKFIPKDELEKEGYGCYLNIFE